MSCHVPSVVEFGRCGGAAGPADGVCLGLEVDVLIDRYAETGGPDDLRAIAATLEARAELFGRAGARARLWAMSLRSRARAADTPQA